MLSKAHVLVLRALLMLAVAIALSTAAANAQVTYTYTGTWQSGITFNVSGYTAPITSVRVTIKGLNVASLNTVGVMLQGPNGKLVIMKGASAVAYNGDLTFAEPATALPQSGAVPVGTYAPRAYATLPIAFPPIFQEEACCVFDVSEAATPAGNGSLSALNGTNANGTWWLRISTTAPTNPTITGAILTIGTSLDLELTKSHTDVFKQGDTNRTYTMKVRNVGATALPSQLVTVNDTLPTGLTAAAFPGSPANGWTCTLSPLKCTRTSALAALASFPDIQMTVNVASNAPTPVNNTASLVIAGDTNASNNTSVDPTTVFQVADLRITNTDNVTTVVPGTPATYTIVATNAGPSLITSAFVSAFFSYLTNVTFTATQTGGATGFPASGTGGISNSVTMPANSAITYVMTGTVSPAAPPGSFPNTATISMPTDGFDTNTANNSATDTDTSAPSANLSLTKTGPADVSSDTDLTWAVTLHNNGPSDAHNVSIADVLPVPFVSQTQTSGLGINNFNLAQSAGTITDTIASFPAGATVTFNYVGHVPPGAAPASAIVNSATVTSNDDPDTSNNTASATAHVRAPDLTIAKTHSQSFKQGDAAHSYTIVVTNSGTGSTAGTVSVTDTLPAGLVESQVSGTGWTCTDSPVACTRSDVLVPGASYPAITVVVSVTTNAPPSVDNTAVVSGGGEVNTANDTAVDTTPIIQAPDLTITQSHTGNIIFGQTGVTITFTVSNSGGGATAGGVSVAEVLGAFGFTVTGFAGSGWTCSAGTITCTRSDVLAGGASYPPITLTFDIEPDADSLQTSDATVSGGGELNLTNDSTHLDLTVFAPWGPPFPFFATTSGVNQVTVDWGVVLGAEHYVIARSTSINGPWTPIATPLASPYLDAGLLPNTTYLYKAQSVDTNGLISAYSTINAATTVAFTDDPIPTLLLIKAVHVTELRTAVNAMRAAAALPAFSFTDPGLGPGTIVKPVHFEELRHALSEARSVFGEPEVFGPDTTVVAGATIKKGDIRLIRTGCK